jgi:hypothetical protein
MGSISGHQSRGNSPPDGLVRVGVVLDERSVRRWHSTAISEIERLGFCELTVFARHSGGGGARARRWTEAARHLLYEAYVRADRRWFGRDDDPLATVPVESCGGATARRVRLPGDPSSASNVAAIAAEDLDVLLCLAPEIPTGRLAACARFGAWTMYAGGLRGRAGEAQLFWQMKDSDFVAPITLRAHTSTEGERTIYESVVASDQVSLHRSRSRAARRAAHLPARRLRDLHQRGWPFITSLPTYAERDTTPERGRSRPSNAMMVRLLWRVARGVASRRLTGRLAEKQWFIAYRRIEEGVPANGDSARLTTITPPAGRFYADPFLFQRDGRRFIFFEDYEWCCQRAVICYVEIDERGRHCPPQVALKQDCHLSYPFVFEENDAVYMLPETAGRRTVELYRASSFPGEWTLDRVLLRDVCATDATLLRHDGLLWLFAAMAVDGRDPAIDELFVFSSDSLEGEWEPHPMNPVVSDVRCARPAGRIFRRDGHLIRPAQDCSRSYGWRLVFNRIEALSSTDYRERPIGAIEPAPDSGNFKTHSYDSDGTYEVLDGFRMRPRISLAGMPRPLLRPRWHRVDLESPGRERSILDS